MSENAFSTASRSGVDRAVKARRQDVLRMLREAPGAKYAFRAYPSAHPEYIVIAYAARDCGTCELSILRERYDCTRFAELLAAQHGASIEPETTSTGYDIGSAGTG